MGCLGEIGYAYLLLASFAVLGGLMRWLGLRGFLWALAACASIVFAVIAFNIQRGHGRDKQSINAKFDDDFSEMYDSMEKNPAYAQWHSDWQDLLRERRNAALSAAEASR